MKQALTLQNIDSLFCLFCFLITIPLSIIYYAACLNPYDGKTSLLSLGYLKITRNGNAN